jgi:hypothetical protein
MSSLSSSVPVYVDRATGFKCKVSGLFHVKTGLPPGIERFFGTWRCIYTGHAKRAAADDRYGRFPVGLLKSITIAREHVIEAEFVNSHCVKLVVRLPWDGELDGVLVVCDPIDDLMVVKTLWFNKHTDTHTTLRVEHYKPWPPA